VKREDMTTWELLRRIERRMEGAQLKLNSAVLDARELRKRLDTGPELPEEGAEAWLAIDIMTRTEISDAQARRVLRTIPKLKERI